MPDLVTPLSPIAFGAPSSQLLSVSDPLLAGGSQQSTDGVDNDLNEITPTAILPMDAVFFEVFAEDSVGSAAVSTGSLIAPGGQIELATVADSAPGNLTAPGGQIEPTLIV